MSTDTPYTPEPTRTDRPADERPRAGARPTGPRNDPWAAPGDEQFTAARAPRTFDPFCTRRLRNCADAANAATPDSGR